MNPHERAARGARARVMMEDELFVEVLATMRQKLSNEFRNCPLRDKEGLHEIHRMMRTVDAFEANFKRIVDDGEQAKLDIEHESLMDKARRAFR